MALCVSFLLVLAATAASLPLLSRPAPFAEPCQGFKLAVSSPPALSTPPGGEPEVCWSVVGGATRSRIEWGEGAGAFSPKGITTVTSPAGLMACVPAPAYPLHHIAVQAFVGEECAWRWEWEGVEAAVVAVDEVAAPADIPVLSDADATLVVTSSDAESGAEAVCECGCASLQCCSAQDLPSVSVTCRDQATRVLTSAGGGNIEIHISTSMFVATVGLAATVACIALAISLYVKLARAKAARAEEPQDDNPTMPHFVALPQARSPLHKPPHIHTPATGTACQNYGRLPVALSSAFRRISPVELQYFNTEQYISAQHTSVFVPVNAAPVHRQAHVTSVPDLHSALTLISQDDCDENPCI